MENCVALSSYRAKMKPWKRDKAREMRNNPTEAEAAAWQLFRKFRRLGMPVGRQRLCLGYILDFYCPSRKLAIEIDGPYHADNKEYDEFRSQVILDRMGIATLRFQNCEVLTNPANVFDTAKAVLLARPVFRHWRQL